MYQVQRLTEALEVDDFPFAQELQGITDIRVVGELDQIFVGRTGLLLGGHIFMQVGDRVALGLDVGGRPGGAGGVDKVEGAVVVGIVAVQAGPFYFFQGSVFY
ncbi:hypothetical protein MOMUL_07650 [Moorella mulderi DSM 14980]|uniref:Uncharacterized protein n=1 Tax=Moorella mulderi DSM 14980 TaxID=1122241 RepID=A0A151B009_9FIRM|nr:hypothetical protein MOMUL_07650 [Moorella mulderi DSM 14980]